MAPTQLSGYFYKECCKSNFKMDCFVCRQKIQRGEYITQVAEGCGMELRPRDLPDVGYITTTGSRWVHISCKPVGVWTWWLAQQAATELNASTSDLKDEDYYSESYYSDGY